jgi:hypothetical protein
MIILDRSDLPRRVLDTHPVYNSGQSLVRIDCRHVSGSSGDQEVGSVLWAFTCIEVEVLR